MVAIITVKYDQNGHLTWFRDENDGGQAFAVASALAGSLVVTGTRNVSSTVTAYYTVKYDSAGNSIWGRDEYGAPVARPGVVPH